MIWLLSQFWIVGLVSLVSGFVVTWLSIVRRINVPAYDGHTSTVGVKSDQGEALGRDPQNPDGAIGFDLSHRSADESKPVEGGERGPATEWAGGSRG